MYAERAKNQSKPGDITSNANRFLRQLAPNYGLFWYEDYKHDSTEYGK